MFANVVVTKTAPDDRFFIGETENFFCGVNI